MGAALVLVDGVRVTDAAVKRESASQACRTHWPAAGLRWIWGGAGAAGPDGWLLDSSHIQNNSRAWKQASQSCRAGGLGVSGADGLE